MARFRYVAVDSAGRERSGEVQAASETAARADLKRRKLLALQLSSLGDGGDQRTDGKGARSLAVSHKERLLVTRQLATLIDAAVPVDEALGMVAAQQDSPRAKRVVGDVQSGVVEGLRLADALGRHSRSFPSLYRAAVAGGERSGKLGFTLNRLADYLAQAHALRSKIQTAMIYPAALSFVAVSVIVCLMIFVVPSLTEQFEAFDTQLPLITRILIGVSSFLTTFWPLLLVAIIGGGYLLGAALRRDAFRTAVDGLILRLPLLGRWAVAVNASRFIRAVSTLTTAGLPVLDSVRAARESAPNRVVSRAIAEIADRIEEGEPFSHAMRKSGVIPVMVVYMAASGENAGELPSMLEKAADHLDQEFDSFTTAALSLLEPAIIVTMGAVVAGIVLAIMLPILQLNQMAIG